MTDIKKLIEDLKSNDLIIRESATSSLSDAAAQGVNISSAVPALITALSDKSSIIRTNAAEALTSAASNGTDISSAIPALERATSDSVPYVSESANKALSAWSEKASGRVADGANENSRFRIYYQGKKQNAKGSPVIIIIFGLIFFGVGAYFIWNDYNALSWDLIKGTVTFSEISEDYDSDGDRMFSAEIDYSYTYNGKTYRGNCCGFSTSDFTSIARMVDTTQQIKRWIYL